MGRARPLHPALRPPLPRRLRLRPARRRRHRRRPRLGLGRARYAAPPELQVTPHHPWHSTLPVPGRPSLAQLPPLLRGYLRIGAFICGAPAHDPEFDVADFFVVLDMERLGDRYRRYFLGER